MPLNRRHQATLETVFADPVRGTIPWRDIEALFAATGADITECLSEIIVLKTKGDPRRH